MEDMKLLYENIYDTGLDDIFWTSDPKYMQQKQK
jgi:hypothetical protein